MTEHTPQNLLAAAPDLLAALEALLDSGSSDYDAWQKAIDQAISAIAKARGQDAAIDADEADDRQMSAELQRCEP